MKTYKILLATLSIGLSALTFSSCLDDDGDYYYQPNGQIVTTIYENDSTLFRTDKGNILLPINSKEIPTEYLRNNKRVALYFNMLSDEPQGKTYAIDVVRIDTVLTKAIAENLGEKNDEVYGKDPVQITSDYIWVGDGFLNTYFDFNYGGKQKHLINLIPVTDSDYTFEFRHNAYGDPEAIGQTGIVAFDLSSLPDTKGETVDLTIKVNTFEGEKTFTLKYNSSDKYPTEPKKMIQSETKNIN